VILYNSSLQLDFHCRWYCRG